MDMKFIEEHNAEAQAAWDAFNAGHADPAAGQSGHGDPVLHL